MGLAAKDLKFQKQVQGLMSKTRQTNVPELPEELSTLDLPQIVDYFKMMAVLENGTTDGWEMLRDDFIKSQRLPTGQDLENQSAALLTMISNKGITAEDQIMNDFSSDTNDVIEKMSRGTVDVDAGADKLQKMQIIEGDMPGQGKEKQGNWGGGNV